MISQEETASFLEQAERFSAEWTAQAQYIQSSFLPQLEALNLRISQRYHVPSVSREALTAFMRRSVHVVPHIRRIATHFYQNGTNALCNHHAITSDQIDYTQLASILFANDILSSSLGTDHDFAMYFDARYKKVLLGIVISLGTGSAVQIYTNYDFYIQVHTHNFEEARVEINYSNYGKSAIVKRVPLWGCGPRENLMVKFVSLAPATSTSVQELVDPAPAQLAEFLRQRKPYIHPVIVLDYVREQSLQDMTAFFGDVAHSELSAAKDKVALTSAAHARAIAELHAEQQASRQDKAQLAAEQARVQEKERENQQQRTKLNTAALRIKKLEIKLAQSESMYEDLQMRLIEMEGLDGGELDSVEGNGGNEDDATQAL